MKKVILFSFFLIGLTCYSQTKNKITANNYLNKTIWSQIFNDFEIKVTIPIVTPWVIGIGNFNYIDNDVFTKNNLKEDNLFTEKDILFKEILSTLDANFLNYVPTDSTMIMRALYKDRLLYTLELQQSDSIFTIDYKLPDNTSGETIIFDKRGNLKSQIIYNPDNKVEIQNKGISDSLFICTTNNDLKNYTLIEENLYSNGILNSKKVFRESKETKKRKFISENQFKYGNNSNISKIYNLDKKGMIIDSIVYFYRNDTLIAIQQENAPKAPNVILYRYNDGKESQKNINKEDFSIQFDKSFNENKISQFEYTDLKINDAKHYDFDYNKFGFLNSVLFKSSSNINNELKFDQQCLLTYNTNQNIQTIKVINNKGVIKKEINYEYDYK
ncbi:MAG: hypothetical protein PHT07_19140 [Paludibacter sp.]|nr:hypothetical protein [Paludibacter sp.]